MLAQMSLESQCSATSDEFGAIVAWRMQIAMDLFGRRDVDWGDGMFANLTFVHVYTEEYTIQTDIHAYTRMDVHAYMHSCMRTCTQCFI